MTTNDKDLEVLEEKEENKEEKMESVNEKETEEVESSNEPSLDNDSAQLDEDAQHEALMAEVKEAEAKEALEIERDRVNTRKCYERAMQYFYEEEGIDPQAELDAKAREEERQKMLDEMSYGQELKERFRQYRSDFNNPLKRKIMIRHYTEVLISIFRAIILFGLCFVIIMPIIEKASYAFRSPLDISNPQVIWIPDQWSIMNVEIAYDLLTKEGRSFSNTFILALITMVLQIFATAIPGYAFARLKFKGSNIIFYIVLASIAIPDEALAVARSLFYNNYGFFGYSLVGSSISIYIMTIFGQGVRSVIFIFLFRQAFRNLPIELEESAEIDGAGVIRTFWSVMLPNVRGTIVTVGLFAFVWQYNDYYFANLYSYSRSRPLLTTSLVGSTENLNSVIATQYPDLKRTMGDTISVEFYELIAQTAALLMMLPLLIGYFFIQKLFVESVERSGLTGM